MLQITDNFHHLIRIDLQVYCMIKLLSHFRKHIRIHSMNNVSEH